MKHAETITPIAAALSALATLACCLPVTFAAGTAMAWLAGVAGAYRWTFLGASVTCSPSALCNWCALVAPVARGERHRCWSSDSRRRSSCSYWRSRK